MATMTHPTGGAMETSCRAGAIPVLPSRYLQGPRRSKCRRLSTHARTRGVSSCLDYRDPRPTQSFGIDNIKAFCRVPTVAVMP